MFSVDQLPFVIGLGWLLTEVVKGLGFKEFDPKIICFVITTVIAVALYAVPNAWPIVNMVGLIGAGVLGAGAVHNLASPSDTTPAKPAA